MKYAIFGAGYIGEKILVRYWKVFHIEIVFDNYLCGEAFHGWQIQKPEYKEDIFIIVCSERYYEIRKQLMEMGYLEFEHFVPYQIFQKKMAITYGNCHMGAVKRYLERNKKLTSEYGFYPFPEIQSMRSLEDYERILPHCKLFIHQSVRRENIYGIRYASDTMMSYIPQTCKVVSIPNLHGIPECFFPQQKREPAWGKLRFMAGYDENIKNWVMDGKTEEDIKKYVMQGGVYSKAEILDKWDGFKRKLLEREKEWDVKISDFIFENYRYIKLFYERYHISDTLVREIASRTLKHLGCDGDIPYLINSTLDAYEMFIYQDVIEALGLKFEQKYIRVNYQSDSLETTDVDIDQYIKQCIKWEQRPEK